MTTTTTTALRRRRRRSTAMSAPGWGRAEESLQCHDTPVLRLSPPAPNCDGGGYGGVGGSRRRRQRRAPRKVADAAGVMLPTFVQIGVWREERR
jgi:hypothetical protein